MARKKNIDIGKENIGEETRIPEEKPDQEPMEKIGSAEFFQGEKVIEDIALPGEKKNIKAETVKKEEIYEDKIKMREAFIASLGRKKEPEEEPGERIPEYIEKRSALGKKILFPVLGIVVLGALAGGGYWFLIKKKTEVPSQSSENQVVIPVNEEAVQIDPIEEQPVPENPKIEEMKPAEIAVKVLNLGAPAGSAGLIKDFLVSQGYTKAEAGNGEASDLAKSYVFFKEEKFKAQAEAVSALLLNDKKLSTEMREASTAEEKGADIVVELGKN